MKLRCCSLLKGIIYLQEGGINTRRYSVVSVHFTFYIAHGSIIHYRSFNVDGFLYGRACTNPGSPAGVHGDNSIISQNTVHSVAPRNIYRGQAHMHSVEEALESRLGEVLLQLAR